MTQAPRSGSGRNRAGRNSAQDPSGKTGQNRDDAKTGRAGKGTASGKGAPKAAGKGQKGTAGTGQKGSAPFAKERFGRSLGPVHRPRRPKAPPVDRLDVHDPDGIRLQKVMASAGVASRRVCEDMIREGRVEVDGSIVTDLGVRVDPEKAAIHVDGIRLQLNETMVYYAFNKPKGVVSTMEDPDGRPCITDFLKNRKGERLFHVGRLDVATEGLLLLTNDGELTNRLTHPSFEVPKTYLVQVRGPMAHGLGAQMKEGIELEDGIAKVDSFRLVDSTPGHVLVEVVLHSGRNRVVRRLFDAIGHPVERLVRTQFGPIRVGDQRQGSIRVLGRQEVGHLLAAVEL
ncbi:23S rRNA pseudouridine2605 synthase/16S rRNA pseudouridine516 synthase [Arthrobacter pigmenti]|uniref:Pseudouridine synthase n=1 Tax=Arthrobacter pigmenti TaxID=271432 RepID=A0A846RPG2_9MICC|nr:pseudouridine synthase [Arthrobacter pigmenti]NJC22037.1 23S rRNA pseudouridine2605 synthase/16S rRNA pseudouridine516 synthase [Arthrobacter pigmenti]